MGLKVTIAQNLLQIYRCACIYHTNIYPHPPPVLFVSMWTVQVLWHLLRDWGDDEAAGHVRVGCGALTRIHSPPVILPPVP
jgi:hypothetical protein